jgi:hypothetical protein
VSTLCVLSLASAAFAAGTTPVFSGAWPRIVGNTSAVTVIFDGDQLATVESVALRPPSGPDRAGTDLVVLEDGRYLMATFDLRGAPLGPYAAVHTVGGSEAEPLAEAVTVEAGAIGGLWVAVTGRRLVRVGTESTYSLWFGHGGNAHMAAAALFLAIPKGVQYTLGFDPADYAFPSSGTSGFPPMPASLDGPAHTLIPLFVRDIPPVPITPLTVRILFGPDPRPHDVTVRWVNAEEPYAPPPAP